MVAFRSRVSIRGFDIDGLGEPASPLPRAVILRGATSLSQERGIPPPVAEPDSGVAATGPGDMPPAQAQHSGKRVAWGGIWSIAGFASRQVVRFGSNLLLTRFLDRRGPGLVAIVWPVVLGVHILFTDFGIGQSIIQNPRGEERAFRNTAWTIQAARGLGLSLVLVRDRPVRRRLLRPAGARCDGRGRRPRDRSRRLRGDVTARARSEPRRASGRDAGTGLADRRHCVRRRLGPDPSDTVGADRLDAGRPAHEDHRQPSAARDRRPARLGSGVLRVRSSILGSGSSSARC